MNGPVDIGDLSPRRYFFTAAVALGLIFALIVDSDEGPILTRLLTWQLQSCLPMALLLVSHLLLLRLERFERLGAWQQLALSGIVGSLLFSPLALFLDTSVFADGSEAFTARELGDKFLSLAPPVTLTWLAINAPFVLGFRLRVSASSGESSPQTGAAPVETAAFMRLVPQDLRGPVLYLQAELHYLAVVTDTGRSLVLYNLRDAIDELGAVAGLQTHRSYWVARSAIESYRREGRQGVLRLRNGDAVPVSRRRMREVEDSLAASGEGA